MLASKLVIEVDTTAIDAALAKTNELVAALRRAQETGVTVHGDDTGKGYREEAVRSGAIVGELSSVALDPLESAISSTATLIADEVDRLHQRARNGDPGGRLVEVFGKHLDALLQMQLDRLAK